MKNLKVLFKNYLQTYKTNNNKASKNKKNIAKVKLVLFVVIQVKYLNKDIFVKIVKNYLEKHKVADNLYKIYIVAYHNNAQAKYFNVMIVVNKIKQNNKNSISNKISIYKINKK